MDPVFNMHLRVKLLVLVLAMTAEIDSQKWKNDHANNIPKLVSGIPTISKENSTDCCSGIFYKPNDLHDAEPQCQNTVR